MKQLNIILRAMIVAMLFSCATISYTPSVNLDISPKTIKKSLMVEKIVDLSPAEDRENPFSGFSVTNEKSIPNDFDLVVTNAIVSDFAINGVFKEVSRRVEEPDFTMKGEVNKYLGRSMMTDYALFSMVTFLPILTWYFGVPVSKNEVEIELTLTFIDKEGNEVASYIGKDAFLERTSRYTNNALAVPNYTNRSLSNAVMQIREQILADYDKYN